MHLISVLFTFTDRDFDGEHSNSHDGSLGHQDEENINHKSENEETEGVHREQEENEDGRAHDESVNDKDQAEKSSSAHESEPETRDTHDDSLIPNNTNYSDDASENCKTAKNLVSHSYGYNGVVMYHLPIKISIIINLLSLIHRGMVTSLRQKMSFHQIQMMTSMMEVENQALRNAS